MTPDTRRVPTPEMMNALRMRAGGKPAITFADFMEVALYDPKLGYYRKDRTRIGYGAGTDFLTATTSAPIFGRLVVAACATILGASEPSGFEFVEIGSEHGVGILSGVSHPFRSVRSVGIGEALTIVGPSVVFSNELFDAQPFRRFRFGSGQWRELGVSLGDTALSEVEMESGVALPGNLPPGAPEGYVIDAPLSAATLAAEIAAQPWTGLFLAFDYGKPWEELAFGTPAGTARAYRRHAQGNDLLAFPGEQDLTCHVCWDWLVAALEGAGFNEPRVDSQEAFLARQAGAFIEAFTLAEAGRVSPDKLSLLQLLHPAHMGQRFQALWGLRL
jgi:SAM-dependent MidA family methyltransferase